MVKRQMAWGADVYDMPERLRIHFHGVGYALVAIKDGELVAVHYLRDIAEEYGFDDLSTQYFRHLDDEYDPNEDDLFDTLMDFRNRMGAFFVDARVELVSKFLGTFGSVHLGHLSFFDFVDLFDINSRVR